MLPLKLNPLYWFSKNKNKLREKYEYKLLNRIVIPVQRELEKINLDVKYNKIDEYEADKKRAHVLYYGKDLKLKLAEVDLNHGKITQNEYEKEVATINDEPWVKVTEVSMDPDNPAEGSLELDWNKQFIDYLVDAGFKRYPEEFQTVDAWFTTICRFVAVNEFSGTGTFDEELEQAIRKEKKHNA